MVSVEEKNIEPPEVAHENIFKLFQTPGSRDGLEGSGIELAIVKSLVTKQDGKIQVYLYSEGRVITVNLHGAGSSTKRRKIYT